MAVNEKFRRAILPIFSDFVQGKISSEEFLKIFDRIANGFSGKRDIDDGAVLEAVLWADFIDEFFAEGFWHRSIKLDSEHPISPKIEGRLREILRVLSTTEPFEAVNRMDFIRTATPPSQTRSMKALSLWERIRNRLDGPW